MKKVLLLVSLLISAVLLAGCNFKKVPADAIIKVNDGYITKYLTYSMAPKSCQDGNSILILKSSLMDFDELFNILEDLFYHIDIIVKEITAH